MPTGQAQSLHTFVFLRSTEDLKVRRIHYVLMGVSAVWLRSADVDILVASTTNVTLMEDLSAFG
jgi:hypothetical protein